MRATILSRDFPPAVGGMGDHTQRLSAELARRGIAVTVVTSRGADAREDFEVRGVVDRWDAAGFRAIDAAVAATEPDVIVWQYNPFQVGRRGVAPTAGTLARAIAARAPLVVLAHELWFPWGRAGLRGLVWAIAQRIATRAVVRHASAVVVTTEQRLADVGHPLARVVRIGANVEPGEPADRRATRHALGIPEGAFVVSHFGSVGPGRDFGPVFGAIERLRARGIDARLLLVGNTGPVPPARGLNGSVLRTGVLDRRAVSAALEAADCYVHPDPAGPAAGRRGSLTAALAHGMPIVAYAGADRSLQLEDGGNVVLCAPDADSVARALEVLASDPDRARRIGEAARDTYRTWFAWERAGEAMARVLRECTPLAPLEGTTR